MAQALLSTLEAPLPGNGVGRLDDVEELVAPAELRVMDPAEIAETLAVTDPTPVGFTLGRMLGWMLGGKLPGVGNGTGALLVNCLT